MSHRHKLRGCADVSLPGLPTLATAGAANLVPLEASRARKYRIPQKLLNRSYKQHAHDVACPPGMHARPPFGCSETWPSLPNRTADATPLVDIRSVGSQASDITELRYPSWPCSQRGLDLGQPQCRTAVHLLSPRAARIPHIHFLIDSSSHAPSLCGWIG